MTPAQAPQAAVTLRMGPFNVRSVGSQVLLDDMHGRIARKEFAALFFANTNFVVTCSGFAARFDDPRITIVNDGIGMDIAARLRHGVRFEENLNGTDFIPRLLRESPTPLKVFMYGGRSEALNKAARVIEQRMAQSVVVGRCAGYGTRSDDVCAQIRQSRPDVVLVALGNPLQERWVIDNAAQLPPALYAGVGALFDFLSQRAPRAPQWVRKLRLEWFYRLCAEPRRLWKRYSIDVLRFFRICLTTR
jgi:beta-1,4-glucosyltransferase